MRKGHRTAGADARDVEAWPGPRCAGGTVDCPSGTLVVIPRYPALKRGANLGRRSGAGLGATPFYSGWLGIIFHTLNVQANRAHPTKSCDIHGRIRRIAKLGNAL